MHPAEARRTRRGRRRRGSRQPIECELGTEHERPTAPAYKILSLDGGGIRGVFPAAFLAKLEEHLEQPIGSYFDLIAGTSTGGIIAIGLGLGLSAKDILKLYEEQGPAIFDQQHGTVGNFVRQRLRGALHWFGSKYSSQPLHDALAGILGRTPARRKPDAPRHSGMASDARARLHLQDGPSSPARDRLQGAGAGRGDGDGSRADLPEAAHDRATPSNSSTAASGRTIRSAWPRSKRWEC